MIPRKKCAPDCTCGRHKNKMEECPEGCRCGRHRGYQKCQPGCACGRHTPHGRYTPEQHAAARERKRRLNREYMLRRRLENPEWAREQARKHYQANGRKYYLKWKFRITPEGLAEMLAAQRSCCYLCGEPLGAGVTHIDHDRTCCLGNRSCGRCIRGITCQLCNQGIGQFRDDPERMRRVAANLEKANARIRDHRITVQSVDPTLGPASPPRH